MTYKSILKGRLEFGGARSFQKVLNMFQSRKENYYKNDVLIKEEDIFDEDSYSLVLPRVITPACQKKTWTSTIGLLNYISQYAVAGEIGAWLLDSGKIIQFEIIEPESDRIAVQAFLKGRALINEEGKHDEAIAAFTKAIDRFERHALAYERRGRVNHKLKNYQDAIYDYTKSIDLYPANASPYFGRGIVNYKMGNTEKAIEDFEMAIKTSIPLQPIYWQAHKRKAICHIEKGDYKGAFNSLKFYSLRNFKSDDPSKEWQTIATFHYGKALIDAKNYKDAAELFKKMNISELENTEIDMGSFYYYKALALKKSGKPGYKKDAKQAAKLGHEKAEELLSADK